MDKANEVHVSSDGKSFNYPTPKASDFGHLKGKTLEVYYYLVEHPGEIGVREIQRELNYNSSSIAAYHLNRLFESRLIEKTEQGRYFVEGDPVKLGALKDHVRVAGFLIPRIAIYGIQAIFSIIISVVLLLWGVDVIFWFIFVIATNVLILIKVILDTLTMSTNLQNV